ncbi:hypothetical protein BN946_scf184980.g17 [Trametes cinnabarina]|uniref:Alpha-methylacyl-CoA racemase n=1 Tax=Pycnoporus cinnabarinus TaxID=5643 RepID=A0A060SE40_PYCCI|nr:hypothetical protein BN946_scf184980.g17 [Trametes cinnabarina]
MSGLSPAPKPPLEGIKVVEVSIDTFAGLAPGPMAGMILADFGADVIRIDRPSQAAPSPAPDVLARGKRSIAIDPKLKDRALGSHKGMAGHDLNYLALSGVLSMLPGERKPEFPLNILADFAGGGLMCATGILLALMERTRSGRGQVVDADMVSGVRYLSSFPLLLSQLCTPHFGDRRGAGLLDGGAPFYNVYTCADGRWMSVGCLEPQFFREFLRRFIGALPPGFALEDGWRPSEDDQHDPNLWPRLKTFMDRGFALQPRDYWAKLFDRSDACAVPVLSVEEAAALAKSSSSRGGPVPAPHPTLERTPSVAPLPAAEDSILARGAHTEEILSEMGMGVAEREALRRDGALGDRPTAKL